MRTIVYIDGFNLYYRALKGTPYKWLDLGMMCGKLLRRHEIVGIKYYTARISSRPNDPDQPVRQQILLRALLTIPNLEIVYGRFLPSVVTMPLAAPSPGGPRFARVVKTEEKGSDVNLATHMIHDGHLNRYESAVIISNDSDLAEPVRIVRHELNKSVGVINPAKHPSRELIMHATFVKHIRKQLLQACQFPEILEDSDGTFHKPAGW
jgi:uncharacterized LabA/DUF88 family protein